VKRTMDLAGLLLVLVGFAVAAVMYPALPNPMPSHWNAAGHVDGWMPKPWGAFLAPIILAGMWLLFLALPRISPRGFEIEPFARAWGYLRVAILAFVLLAEILVLRAATQQGRLSGRTLFVGLGVLFMVIGNLLGKVTRNFFVGIRTPWTLASEEVWYRTHRLGGKLFVAAGFVVAASAFLDLGPWPLVFSVVLAALVSVVYSYLIYKKLEGLPAAGPSA
jgi:uncharacterized membrane protein